MPVAASRRVLLASMPAAAAALTACASPFGGGAEKPFTLEFWGGPAGEQRQGQLKAWNERGGRIKAHFQPAPSVGQGVAAQRAYAAAAAAHTAPDVVDFDRFQIAAFANWRLFRPIDDLLARDKLDLERYAAAAIEEATGLDRKRYGLPSSVDNRLLYWSKEQFAQSGLDPETPPASWDELADFATRLTRRTDRVGLERLGFQAEEGQSTLHIFAWQNGGGFQSEDGKTATLPASANEAALGWMVGLTRGQSGWPETAAFQRSWGTGARHPFLAGQLGMQYQLPGWAGDVLARHRPDFALGVAAPPARRAGELPLTWSGGYSYVLGRQVKNVDAAWSLVQWLVSEEAVTLAADGELARAKRGGGVFLPEMTGQPALDGKLFARYRTGIVALDQVPVVALALMARSRIRERSLAAADLWDGVLTAQHEAISGLRSPADALATANVSIQRALDQAWVFVPT